MNGSTRLREQQAGGYATGYAVIAGALGLCLLVILPLSAGPLGRLLGHTAHLITGQ